MSLPINNIFIPDSEDQDRRFTGDQLTFGTQLVASEISGIEFSKTTLSLNPNSVTVIVGDNVRAREELAGILAGTIMPASGKIDMPKNSVVEYIQPSLTEDINPSLTIRDFWSKGRRTADGQSLYDLQEQLDTLYATMGSDPDAIDKAGVVQEKFEHLDGWSVDEDLTVIMQGLKISANKHDTITPDTRLGDMSSGQISKAIIGRALFSRASLIVMSDPSVHLDVASSSWLQTYVKQSKQTVVVATSDMQFAETVADKTIEVLDCGIVIQVATGLNQYYTERERIITNWCDEAKAKKIVIEELEIHIRDFLAPAAKRTDNMAQVLRANYTKLEHLKRDYEAMPGKAILDSKRSAKPKKFFANSRSGTKVLDFSDYTVAYELDDDNGGTNIIDIANLEIHNGDRVAIVGRNGSGKSTLLRSVMSPDESMAIDGVAAIGPSVVPAYYSPYTTLLEQSQGKGVTKSTPLREAIALQGTRDVGGIMEYWGFGRSDHYNTNLSQIYHHDEDARAQMALMMAKHPSLLVLDEPTSYLSPEYRQRLQDSLIDYDGTLIVVSHDPNFLGKLALNHVLDMPGAKYKRI